MESGNSWKGQDRVRGYATIMNIILQINELLQRKYINKKVGGPPPNQPGKGRNRARNAKHGRQVESAGLKWTRGVN
ncbi:hypothetical protein EMIT0196MI5_170001 [Pseudomonas sp. IT-196MI5]